MEVCLMIEGQQGVTWEQWMALAAACEEQGLAGLFRSDHYLPFPADAPLGSHDAWAVLSALAARTERIRLGTLVSPVRYRHPSELSKVSTAVDHISGGRIEVGMGAGWFAREHEAFGFPFPEPRTRIRMLAEQLEIVHRLWHEDVVTFEGEHYRLDRAPGLPKPVQDPHPPIVMGGSAGPVSARLSAKWADEYNVNFVTPERCRNARERVAAAWEAEGRDLDTLRFSAMTRCIVGAEPGDLRDRLERQHDAPDDIEAFLASPPDEWIVGTVDQVIEQLQRYADAGVDRIMLQHLAVEDLEMVAIVGREIVPAVA
jgi:F420-dependent oxidoreductase-like protein